MDPNWVLIEARNAVGDFRNALSIPETERSATKLADAFETLDEWLCKGGFLPADWLPAVKLRDRAAARGVPDADEPGNPFEGLSDSENIDVIREENERRWEKER